MNDDAAIKTPRPSAQIDMYHMKRLISRQRGDGAGSKRAASPATRPSAVKSPQHSTTPRIDLNMYK